MSHPSIALSRFGYGLSAKDSPPADPRAFLLSQMVAYDPAPAAIAGRVRSRGETGAMVELVRSSRKDRKAIEAMAEAAPAMPGQSDPDENPRAAALEGLPPEYRRKLGEARQVLAGDIAARVNLAVNSPAPMIERLVHFWSNHFSVSVGKVGTQFEAGPHEFTAIRPHVLGRFSDMLKAAVLHPAMLLYLDQFQSIGPTAPFAQRRAQRGGDQPERPRGLNENLAREVLELHTLGVQSGYTQTDAPEAWTPEPVKFRTPFEWLIGALRLSGVRQLPPQRIVGALNELGQVPWRAPSPASYDDVAASWAGPDALVRRVEMAERIAGSVPAEDVPARAEAAFPGRGAAPLSGIMRA